jgi:hypothetical protein
MFDPISIAAIKVACDLAVGTIPDIIPLVHDENSRKRLARLQVLLQKVGDEGLTSEELAESNKLHSDVERHALMTQNTVLLAWLKNVILLLRAQKTTPAEKLIDPAILAGDNGEFRLLLDLSESARHQVTPSGTTPPAYSPMYSPMYSPTSPGLSPYTVKDEREDPINEAIANATTQKTHPRLKKAACWSLVLTVGPVALVAPQVRRNLIGSRTKPRNTKLEHI